MHYLERRLGSTNVAETAMKDLATGLVLREIHQDEIAILQDKLSSVQRSLKRARTQGDLTIRESIDGMFRTPSALPKPRPGSAMSRQATVTDLQSNSSDSPPIWDVPTKNEELESFLRGKDEIIKRKDEEYNKLRTLLEDNQNHLENVLDINNQYLLIISQFNAMQLNSNSTSTKQKDREIADLEQKLEEAEQKVDELNTEFGEVCEELKARKNESDKLGRKQHKYKEMLGLSFEADDHEVEQQIMKLLEDGTMQRHELDKIKKELNKTSTAKIVLEDKISILSRDKEKIEFHMRQQDLTIKKMKRMKQASYTIQAAENIMSQYGADDRGSIQMKLPSIGRMETQIGLAATQKIVNRTGRQYCIFCRQEYFPLKSPLCRIHYRAMRDNQWTCCRDSCHRSAGCLQIAHFYIEITVDRKIFLTDGARYWELS